MSSEVTPSEDNKEIVRRFYKEILEEGCLDVADDLFDPNWILHEDNEVGFWTLEESKSSGPAAVKELEQFAMSLDYVAPCTHGRLLRRSAKEDSGSRTPARHGQERGCSHLRGESFLGQTLRQSSSRRTLALSGEGTWQATEAL
jgi:hypothetical protein